MTQDVALTPEEKLAEVMGDGRDPADPVELEGLVRDYQNKYELLEDGVLGTIVERHLDQPRFCGTPDNVHAASSPVCRWDKSVWRGAGAGWSIGMDPAIGWDGQIPLELELTWYMNQSNDILKAAQGALDLYPGICAIRYRRTNSVADANINMEWGRIDGPGSVLAWSELSCGPDRQLKQRYGAEEDWWFQSSRAQQGRTHFRATVWHEVGHANGLDHGGTGLMAPFAQNGIWLPQAGYDIDSHILRYGPPISSPPPPVGTEKRITINLDGDTWEGVVTKKAA